MDNQFRSEIISAIIQLGIIILIAFICFLLRKDKSKSFFQYIGWIKPVNKAIGYAFIVSIIFTMFSIGLNFINEDLKQATISPGSMIGKLRLMELNSISIIVLLVTALFKTSLAEEILFRGLLAKRLIYKLGFNRGNVIQSVIFGAMHVLIFVQILHGKFLPLFIIFILISLLAWVIGYVQERIGNGSIIPSWIIHGVANVLSYYFFTYVF